MIKLLYNKKSRSAYEKNYIYNNDYDNLFSKYN